MTGSRSIGLDLARENVTRGLRVAHARDWSVRLGDDEARAYMTEAPEDVRAAMAADEGYCDVLLDVLVNDPSPVVRRALLSRTAAAETCRMLSADIDPRVREAALWRLAQVSDREDELEELFRSRAEFQEALASNPHASSALLERLDASETDVSRHLLGNPGVRWSMLADLPSRQVYYQILVQGDAPGWEALVAAHPSGDMVRSMLKEWEGTVGELLDLVAALDRKKKGGGPHVRCRTSGAAG